MTNIISGSIWYPLLDRRLLTVLLPAIVALQAFGADTGTGVVFDVERAAVSSAQLQQQQMTKLFQDKLKGGPPELVERAKSEFLDSLRRNSPLASEKLLNGKMDDEELESRVVVFLRDRPALTSTTAKAESVDPRKQIVDLLRRDPAIAGTEPERLVLADRFIERLGQRSPTARNELLRGKMSSEELQSRVSVFVADLRSEVVAVQADPKAAAAQAIVDAFLKANYLERANDIVYKAEIEAEGVKRECVVFKKRPGKLRMHIVEGGLVIGALGFDGTTAWRQLPGKAGMPAANAEADALKQLSRFDHPLVDYREHGTVVTLGDKLENGLQLLHIRETDGTETTALIDPTNYNEVISRTRQSDGKLREIRSSDFRKLGAVNLAYVQEEWVDGKLRSTTRISQARVDAGLIDQFFVRSINPVFSYMDFVGGLAAIKAQQAKNPPALKSSAGGAK